MKRKECEVNMKKIIITIMASILMLLYTIPATAVSNNLKFTKNTQVYASDYYGVAYSYNIIVAVGKKGEISTSKDGEKWTSVSSNIEYDLNGVIWSGKFFLAVGSDGIIKSTDGIKWTTVLNTSLSSSSIKGEIKSIAYNGKTFIAVGSNMIISSVDGVKWTMTKTIAKAVLENKWFDNVLWNGKVFVTYDRKDIFYSTDGVKWNHKNMNHNVDVLAWNNNTFIEPYYTYDGKKIEYRMYYSQDLITWNDAGIDPVIDSLFKSIKSCNNMLFGFSAGSYYTSQDGLTWRKKEFGYDVAIKDIIYLKKKGIYVAVGDKVILTSKDGSTWTKRVMGITNYHLNAISYNGKKYVAVGDDTTIITSTDGYNWSNAKKITHLNYRWYSPVINGIAWGRNKFVAVGYSGTIYVSDDGDTWMQIESGTNTEFMDIIYQGNLFTAVGFNGAIYTSQDGVKWVKRNSGSTSTICSIKWTGKFYIAAGYDGNILKSSDSINWTKIKTKINNEIYDVSFNGKIYVAVGSKIYTSTDTKTWKANSKIKGLELLSVTWDGNRFIAVGRNWDDKGYAAIYTSVDGLNWVKHFTENKRCTLNKASVHRKTGFFTWILWNYL